MPSTKVFQQKRETVAGSAQAIAAGYETDLHQEMSVKHDKDGLVAEASIYNVAHDTWKQVKQGDPFRVSLGYADGPYEHCIVGVVHEKHPPEQIGADVKYTIKGRDNSGSVLRNTYKSHTWNKPAITDIIRDIASFAGLSPGFIAVSARPLERRWSISKEHNLYYWLRQLVKETNERTSVQHEVFAEAGKLFFKPKGKGFGDAITIKDGKHGNVIKIDEAEGKDKKSGGGSKLDFEMLLDPRVRKGSFASISTKDYHGIYQIMDYELSSSTESGDHTLKGTLTPVGSEYNVVPQAPPLVTSGHGGPEPI